jgi:hypothetical protein
VFEPIFSQGFSRLFPKWLWNIWARTPTRPYPEGIKSELRSGPCIRKDQPRARRGRARHSVYAAAATSAYEISLASPSRPAVDQDHSQVSRPNFGFQVKSSSPALPRRRSSYAGQRANTHQL